MRKRWTLIAEVWLLQLVSYQNKIHHIASMQMVLSLASLSLRSSFPFFFFSIPDLSLFMVLMWIAYLIQWQVGQGIHPKHDWGQGVTDVKARLRPSSVKQSSHHWDDMIPINMYDFRAMKWHASAGETMHPPFNNAYAYCINCNA